MRSQSARLFLRYHTIRKDSESDRLITVVGSQAFYRSTGRNSECPDTFFPFDGFELEFNSVGKPFVWLMKPAVSVNKLEKYFPFDFLVHIDPYQSESLIKILQRMGNFKKLIISMLIGGGFWHSSEGKMIEKIIHDHYPKHVHDLATRYGDAILTIKQIQNKNVISINSPRGSSLDQKLKTVNILNAILKNAIPTMSLNHFRLVITQDERKKTYDLQEPVPRKYTLHHVSFYSPKPTVTQTLRATPRPRRNRP